MDINRNNYEEYFLLYADNELTDSEKAEVLMFLKENKDLEEEFRTIHFTICKPDVNIALADKSFLFKENSEAFINRSNYEEVFVLYHDNELSSNQKTETEDFLSLHAQLKNEFELIGLAKLVPEESVIFPNKKKLYKKEKPGKVVPIIFWRALVAAVFIGLGLWVTELYIQKGKDKPSVAVKSIPAKQITPVTGKNVVPDKKPVNTIVQSGSRNLQPSRTEIIPGKEKLQKSVSPKNANSNALVKTSVKTQKPGQENLINQSADTINNEAVISSQKIKNISEEQIAANNTIEPSRELAQKATLVNANVQPVIYVQNSSYVSDANDKSQNYVFYDITTEVFKKTKVSSFLKKVKRVIERNNPISRLLSGDERQVVSK